MLKTLTVAPDENGRFFTRLYGVEVDLTDKLTAGNGECSLHFAGDDYRVTAKLPKPAKIGKKSREAEVLETEPEKTDEGEEKDAS